MQVEYSPLGLASRSVIQWCHEPARQFDLDTDRHQGMWRTSLWKLSTQWRIAPAGYPASLPLARRCAMDVVFTHCAGLDVHKKTVTACRVTPDPSGQQANGILELKEFGTMTADLLAL